ncbi:MAG: ParA family protein [Culicoidibacterales bacterium]
MAKVIGLIGNKSGTLKTTIATQLTLEIAQNKTVCIVDLNNQSDVSNFFNIDQNLHGYTIYDVLMKRTAIEDIIYDMKKNVSVIISDFEMSYFDINILKSANQIDGLFDILKPHIEVLRDLFDYIILDAPSNMGIIVGNILNCADDILIPYDSEVSKINDLIKTIILINEHKIKNSNLQIKAVIPVKVDEEINHKAMFKELYDFLEQNSIKITNTLIKKSDGMISPWNEASVGKTYQKLCKELGYTEVLRLWKKK